MKRLVLAAALVSSVVTSGCSTVDSMLTSETSGAIGCPSNLITISDKNLGMFTSSWTAKCNNKTYYCIAGNPTSCRESQIANK